MTEQKEKALLEKAKRYGFEFKDFKEFANNALTLVHWMLKEIPNGNLIGYVDAKEKAYKAADTTILYNAAYKFLLQVLKKLQKGYIFSSINEKDKRWRQLEMPFMKQGKTET